MDRVTFPKRQQYWEGRQTLLRAALAILQRKGFEATTVREICQEAGYSKGGFYFHFQSKEALISELLKEAPADALHDDRLLSAWPHTLLPQLWAEAPRSTAIREWLAHYYSRRLEQMRKGVKALVRHDDPDVVARLILALESGLQIQWQVMTSPFEKTQIRRALKDLMLEPASAVVAA